MRNLFLTLVEKLEFDTWCYTEGEKMPPCAKVDWRIENFIRTSGSETWLMLRLRCDEAYSRFKIAFTVAWNSQMWSCTPLYWSVWETVPVIPATILSIKHHFSIFIQHKIIQEMTESQLVLLYNPWSQTPYLSTTLSQFVTNITCSTCPGATTINL